MSELFTGSKCYNISVDIVILHGWGHSSSMWQGFASKFHGHKVLALDLPGFGNEKLVSENWDIKDYSQWVVKKLKEKRINNAIVIGHSFGGKIATQIAIDNPKLVKKLILVAAPVLRRPSLATQLKIAIHKLVKKTFVTNSLNTITNKEYKDAKENNLGKAFVNSVNYDATDKLNKINSHTLIIWGEEDPDAPLVIGEEMHKLISNSKLEVLKNTGHNIYLENPNILYGLVKNFLNEKNN